MPLPDIPRSRLTGWFARMIASRRFQKWATRSVFTRGVVRREGAALFNLLSGFCQSQVLMALVQLDILRIVLDRPLSAEVLAQRCNVPPDRMVILLRAAVALKLLKARRDGKFGPTRRGAALVGVPGLAAMIRHHDVFYRDLADPAAFFRGETATELAHFWPYVFGGAMQPEVAATYSDLMAQSLVLVAEDSLCQVDLGGVKTLLDIGGGSGAFIEIVGRAYPKIEMVLFDLEEVAPAALARFDRAGIGDRTRIACGSFKTDSIPQGADAISLVRVLYDHDDRTVANLLVKCFNALPHGGRLIITEPMLGGDVPDPAGDVYFALYTLAMQTGKTRSVMEISALCVAAGFDIVAAPEAFRPFVTRCVEFRKG